MMVLDNLYSLLCLSLATRGTPRLYGNTFFWPSHRDPSEKVETGRAPCRQQKSKEPTHPQDPTRGIAMCVLANSMCLWLLLSTFSRVVLGYFYGLV